MSGRDRRQYPRLEGQFNINLLNMGDDSHVSPWSAVLEGTALDVSMRGMCIRATYDVPVGAYIGVVFYYQGHESICLCETVWKRPEGDGLLYGLFFKEWSKLEPSLDRKLRQMEPVT